MPNQLLEETEAPPAVEFVKLNKLEKPREMFFYQRIAPEGAFNDLGEPLEFPIFACGEGEAASLKPHKFRQIGVSDGQTYYRYIQTHIKPRVSYPIEEARKIQIEAEQAELAVARGHFKRPRNPGMQIVSVSSDVRNPEELIRKIS